MLALSDPVSFTLNQLSWQCEEGRLREPSCLRCCQTLSVFRSTAKLRSTWAPLLEPRPVYTDVENKRNISWNEILQFELISFHNRIVLKGLYFCLVFLLCSINFFLSFIILFKIQKHSWFFMIVFHVAWLFCFCYCNLKTSKKIIKWGVLLVQATLLNGHWCVNMSCSFAYSCGIIIIMILEPFLQLS